MVTGQGLKHYPIDSSLESINQARISVVETSRPPVEENLPLGCRVVPLSITAAPKEVLQIQDPRDGRWSPVHVFYDTGAEISGGTVDLLPYDTNDIQTVTEVIDTLGFNSRKDIRFEQARIVLKGARLQTTVDVLCEKECLKPPPNELLDVAEWRNEVVALPPTKFECEQMPFILLGQPDSQLHPIDLDYGQVPTAIRSRYPNLSWKRSVLSGQLLYWGTIRTPERRVYQLGVSSPELPYEFTHDATPPGTKPHRVKPQEEDDNFCGALSVYQKLKKLNHDDILAELNSLVVPSSMSPQTGDVRKVGCWNCDPWTPYIYRRKENASYLVRQLTWAPWEAKAPWKGGRFVLNRELSEKAKFFPSGSRSAMDNLKRLEK